MRYRPEHKQQTKARIVQQAGRLFRRFGYAGVGIDGIMAAAKLTRGGFYGYFRSKAELFAEVMRGEHDFNKRMQARDGKTSAELTQQALEVVAGYLHPDNRRRVGQGCAMASLSVDVARAGRPVREAYTRKVEELAGEFARGLPDADGRDPRILASIALCVGGLIVARGVHDDALATDTLNACRAAVGDNLTAGR